MGTFGNIVRIIARSTLLSFWQRHPDSEQQLKSWYSEVRRAKWKNPKDIKQRYARVSILKSGRVIFNVCGNKYRLVVRVNYDYARVYIRFIGTHREYDLIDGNTI